MTETIKPRGYVDSTKVKLDWNHIYLLAWYRPDGHAMLTTWRDSEESRLNYIQCVVTGPDVMVWGPPIWAAPKTAKPNDYGVPSHPVEKFTLHPVLPGEDWEKKAAELGGVRAYGWYFEKGFERKW